VSTHRRVAAAGVLVALVAAACGASAASPSAPWQTGGPIPSAAPSSAPSAPAVTQAPSPEAATFKLLNFNIEYGGDEVDFAKVIEAIKAADPDVVALEEAEGNTAEVAEALGWPYHSVRSQLVSKLPLIDPQGADGDFELVEIRPGEVVAIVNVHLPSDPYGPYLVRDGGTVEQVLELETATRLPALQPKLDAVADVIAAGIPTFVVGDFNAPSHLDWTSATVGTQPQILYPVEWPVSKALEAAGFTDAYRAVHPDPVADPGLTWWAGRPLVDGYPDHADPQDRIDQIHVNGEATPTETRILGEVGGPQVDISVDPWGSDHRGVMATFDLTPGAVPVFVSVDTHHATVGDTVVARYRGTGTEGERIVVRRAEDTAGVPVSEHMLSAGAPDGTAELATTGLAPGDYEVQLLHATGGVTTRTPLHVAAEGATPTLTLASSSVAAGEPIEVTFTGTPGARWDWFGLYPRGGDPTVDDYLYYAYTGSRVSGTTTIDEAGEGDWPFAPGEYDLLLLSDDGYEELARVPLTITP
jgi:endonuclease/exonuclease/phosphatase family metal-dependent hydrolase